MLLGWDVLHLWFLTKKKKPHQDNSFILFICLSFGPHVSRLWQQILRAFCMFWLKSVHFSLRFLVHKCVAVPLFSGNYVLEQVCEGVDWLTKGLSRSWTKSEFWLDQSAWDRFVKPIDASDGRTNVQLRFDVSSLLILLHQCLFHNLTQTQYYGQMKIFIIMNPLLCLSWFFLSSIMGRYNFLINIFLRVDITVFTYQVLMRQCNPYEI